MINRRRFLQGLIVAAATPRPASARTGAGNSPFGNLVADRNQVLDLPAGFSYQVISTRGDTMDDGLLVPGAADGMAAFAGDDGNVVLVCNHENAPYETIEGPWGAELDSFPGSAAPAIYDAGRGATPGNGGTTTIVYDPHNRRVLRRHLSLAGTELNCAGGATPWGSWLSCEECFKDPGTSFEGGRVVHRERRHGYVFEIASSGSGLAEPVPLKAMGRFEHEAAAVDPRSGIVYLTEDRHRSLFYRFIPRQAGRLAEGGKLQALAVVKKPGFDTRNWSPYSRMAPRRAYNTAWIDLENVDSDSNDLRLRGRDRGAAIFARGEGLCRAGNSFAFSCTIGGRDRLGQVFVYSPSKFEGRPEESRHPGNLSLLAEATPQSMLRHADNLTLSPWGDLIVCEDTADHCGLVGIRPDGGQYALADNAYGGSELAGICFSPDGTVMFVNIQYRGLTLAITGPWRS
ncbi:MAG: PhoX family protein [Gammaproteobacteria bacterium]|nr:PhoX family protein [Gammaproteobacteria bacterium]MDH4315661.1 PhoX family protein [Gammaproteobacteria bacterium]